MNEEKPRGESDVYVVPLPTAIEEQGVNARDWMRPCYCPECAAMARRSSADDGWLLAAAQEIAKLTAESANAETLVAILQKHRNRLADKPPCGGPRCSYAMNDGQRIESHAFEPGEECADHTTERTGCTLHGGIHYIRPLVHSVIRDIRDPGLAGSE